MRLPHRRDRMGVERSRTAAPVLPALALVTICAGSISPKIDPKSREEHVRDRAPEAPGLWHSEVHEGWVGEAKPDPRREVADLARDHVVTIADLPVAVVTCE